ncbi:MAG: hypothetical protein JRD68_00680 [Deltaproteobacteria bacterium]|nr:hypothetical protein [Deltaproteobacteria bacterium]
MITYKSPLKWALYLLAPWLIALFTFTGTAMSASVNLEYSLGFNGIFKLSSWTPLTISLENRGRSFNGSLEVIVTRGSEYVRDVKSTTYSVDVSLPPGSQKSFSFTVLIDTFIHPLKIRLEQAGETIISTSLNLRSHYSDRSLAVILGDNIASTFLNSLPEEFKAVIPHAEFLPHTWFGYDGVGMIIANTKIIDRLRKEQLQALSDWLERGGFLILHGGHNYGSLQTHKIQRFLRVDIQGFKEVVRLDSLEQFSGHPLQSKNPFLILRAEVVDARPLLKEHGMPIITQKQTGRGKIIFTAFDFQDHPFTNWDGSRDFWNAMRAQKPQPDFFASKHQDQEIHGLMISRIVPAFPGFLLTFGFLLIYLACGQIFFNQLVKKRAQRRRYLTYLAVMVAIFSVSCLWVYYQGSIKKALTYNSYTRLKLVGNDQRAAVKYTLGFYSLRDEGIELRFNPASNPLKAVPSNRPEDMPRHSFTLHQTKNGQTAVIPMDRWTHRFFQVDSMIDFQLQAEAVMEESALRLLIKNKTPYDIVNARLFYAGRSLRIGNIPRGKVQEMRFSRKDLNRDTTFSNQDEARQKRTAPAQTPLLRLLRDKTSKGLHYAIEPRFKEQKDTLYIIGWIDSEVRPSGLVAPAVAGESAALLEWEITVQDNS